MKKVKFNDKIKEVRICQLFRNFTVKMYLKEGERHHKEHVHIFYNEYNAVYDIKGKIIEGSIPLKQRKIVEAWIAIHEEELKILWTEINEKGKYFKIEPLK